MKTARTVAFSVRLLASMTWLRPALGVALITTTASTALVACADEADPKTWVKRLDDPLQRGKAVAKLKEMFESKLTAAKTKMGNDTTKATAANAPTEYDDADVKALLDTIVDPLTKLYAAPPSPLEDTLRKDLMQFLSDMRDPRTGPAFAKALNDYDQGKADDDMRVSCDAILTLSKAGKMSDPQVLDALWNVFAKYRLSKKSSDRTTLSLHNAIRDVGGKNQSYGTKAQTMLGNNIKKLDPPDKDNPNALDPDDQTDQLGWWQLTAVQIISDLHFAPAIKTLVTVLLTQTKLGLNPATRTALLKMAKEAEPVIISGINGTDPDLKKLGDAFGAPPAGAPASVTQGPNKGVNLALLSDTLAFLSRPAGRDAVLGLLANDAANNDTTRTAFAQALVQFPSSPAAEPAFMAAYNKLTPNSTIAPALGGSKSRQLLIQVAADFYDPSMTDFLIHEALAGTDPTGKLTPFDGAIKIMSGDKKKLVGDAFDKVSPDIAKPINDTDKTSKAGEPKAGDKLISTMKEIFTASGKVLDECKQDAMCYVKTLDEDIPSKPATANSRQVKACYMAVVYAGASGDKVRGEMVSRLDKVRDMVARLALVKAIDELAPKGDAAAADAFDKIIAKDAGLGDNSLTQADDAVAKIALRLRARAM